MATFIGTNGDDIYTGTGHDDSIDGVAGDDTLAGAGGSDSIQGGAGADILVGGSGDDFLASYMPDDQFFRYPFRSSVSLDIYNQRDSLDGGAGDDKIAAGFGDSVDGGSGQNYLYINFQGAKSGVHADFYDLYLHGSVTIGGGVITNISEVPNIQGSEFDDYLRPITDGYSSSLVHGNGGDDTVIADYYTDEVYGDAGNDTLDGTGSQYIEAVHGGDGDDTIYGPLGESFGVSYGDAGNDTILANMLIYGGSGDDAITSVFSYYANDAYGDEGDDTITVDDTYGEAANRFFGGAGADTLSGGDGGDTLYADGEAADNKLDVGLEHDVLLGGADNDILSIGYNDDADGGTGSDTITMVWAADAAGVDIDTAAITSGPFAFGAGVVQNVEKIDSLYMTGNADVVRVSSHTGRISIYGQGGDDHLTAGGGLTYLAGGDGADTLVAAAAKDKLEGGLGDDVYVINHIQEVVIERADEGVDTVQSSINYALGGSVENLILTGSARSGGGNSLDNALSGGSAKNSLAGYDGDDTLSGLGANDKLDGGNGDDSLFGGLGHDVLKGGSFNDLLVGGEGADRMFGGTGADIFRFQGMADFGGATAETADVIVDFRQAAHDLIDLAGVDAVSGGVDDAFAFIGTAAFSGTAGELRYEHVGKTVEVTGDVDGDGAADFMIVVSGKADLVQTDFVL